MMALLVSQRIAEARLGETPEQCDARYGEHREESSFTASDGLINPTLGKDSAIEGSGLIRRKYVRDDGIWIWVYFATDGNLKPTGGAVGIVYSSLPRKLDYEPEQPLNESPYKDLLLANDQGKEWKVFKRNGVRDDGAVAVWHTEVSNTAGLAIKAPNFEEEHRKAFLLRKELQRQREQQQNKKVVEGL